MSAPGRHAWSARRRVLIATLTLVTCAVFAACGSSSERSDTLRWFVGPDQINPEALARTCTDLAGGQYRIVVEQLPRDISARHDEVVRRLRAGDDRIDLLSLDTAFTAEFAAAGMLAPIPTDTRAESKDVAPAAVAAATYDDQLVVIPWILNPQVLWFRGNVAERAGLDTTKPVTWDALIAGAQRLGVTIEMQDVDGSGVADWTNALVSGAGGAIVGGVNVDSSGRNAAVGLDSAAGRSAASLVELFHDADVGPGPSAAAFTQFASANGGFLIASASARANPALASVAADMVATAYPATADLSVSPLSGVSLAVPQTARSTARSFAAIGCLTAPEQLKTLAIDAQQTVAQPKTYSDAQVRAAFPQAKVAGEALMSGVVVPSTPYWFQVMRALDETWRPIAGVTQDATPTASQAAVEAAVRGTLP